MGLRWPGSCLCPSGTARASNTTTNQPSAHQIQVIFRMLVHAMMIMMVLVMFLMLIMILIILLIW